MPFRRSKVGDPEIILRIETMLGLVADSIYFEECPFIMVKSRPKARAGSTPNGASVKAQKVSFPGSSAEEGLKFSKSSSAASY
jgi:hypothetical protein